MARRETYYLRNPRAVLVGAGAKTIVSAPGGASALLPLAGTTVSQIVRVALEPVTAAALRRHATARALALLVAHRVLLAGDDPARLLAARGRAPRDAAGARPCRHLVLGVTGAVNAIHAPALAAHLAHHVSDRVDVVLTRAARKLVRAAAFRYLGLEVWTDAFATRGEVNVPHMHLASAELVVILPATAATVHKLATGACSDLLSLVCAATRAPLVIAPSMNVAMWDDPAIAANVRALRERGAYLIEPAIGVEVSAKDRAGWELGPSPIDPPAIAEALRAVLAARAAQASATAAGTSGRRAR